MDLSPVGARPAQGQVWLHHAQGCEFTAALPTVHHQRSKNRIPRCELPLHGLNLAKAVASINELGTVVGDLNESGALVSQQQGFVTLVDSDSMQYSSKGTIYRCTKGKAEYTPPELQSRSFDMVDRTINHDAFGLAVLLFEILFLGRHPFSGVPRTPDHPTIAEAIQSALQPATSRQNGQGVSRVARALPFSDLSPKDESDFPRRGAMPLHRLELPSPHPRSSR
jgi:DNA-binding helix-hairpin-helix protein with protein kinase domain